MKNYVKYILSLVIFGSNGIFAAYIAMDSGELVLMRTVIGGAFLLCVIALGRKWLPRGTVKREWKGLLASGVFLGLNWILLFESYKLMSVSLATLCYYCAPIIVLAASPWVLHEKLEPRSLLGIAVVVAGMLLATGVGGSVTTLGLLCGLASAVFYAAMILVNKTVRGVDGLNLTFIQLIVAACIMLPYVLVRTGGVHLPGSAFSIFCLLFLCIVNTGVACWLYFSSMQELPARSVALFGYVDPISALIFSAIFLGERLGALQIVGAALVIGGAALGELKRKPAPAARLE